MTQDDKTHDLAAIINGAISRCGKNGGPVSPEESMALRAAGFEVSIPAPYADWLHPIRGGI